MTYKALIFDIDGTLADTLPICVDAYRETLQHYVGRPFQEEEITRYFGMSEEGILGIYISPERLPEAADWYFAMYEHLHQTCREPFAGLRATIEGLHARGIPVAVVTGKGERGAEVTLRVLRLHPYLSGVEAGSKEGPNKPKSLRRVLAALNLSVQEAVYVGDSAYDIEAASSIGMPVVGAAWAKTTTILNGAGDKALRVFYQIDDF